MVMEGVQGGKGIPELRELRHRNTGGGLGSVETVLDLIVEYGHLCFGSFGHTQRATTAGR